MKKTTVDQLRELSAAVHDLFEAVGAAILGLPNTHAVRAVFALSLFGGALAMVLQWGVVGVVLSVPLLVLMLAMVPDEL